MSTAILSEPSTFDVQAVRADFPALDQRVHGKPLIYLDNAATTQKPRVVLEVLRHYYEADNANIHRAVHELSQRATRGYEDARGRVRRFLNAAEDREVLFVRGCTEGINLVAQSYGRSHLQPGDEVILSHMEHHANIVPWQMICEERQARIRVVPINERGEFQVEAYAALLNDRTRFVSVVHLSNSLGSINPVRAIIDLAHARGVPVLLDAAQSAAHQRLDVRDLDCDFLVLSGHKLYGPTGIGILYGKAALLEAMPPYQGGGDMIRSVTFERTTYADLPNKFEAGTPHIAGAIGLAAAIDWLEQVGLDRVAAHEAELLDHATDRLSHIPGVRIVGTAAHKAGVISFVVDDPPLSPLDIGTRLDLEGIAIRTGHHCCQPVMERYHLSATARASFAVYNTLAEVDAFADALERIIAAARASAPAVAASSPGMVFPRPTAASPDAAAEQFADLFESLDDWPTRHEYLVDLGRKLPMMPPELKTDATLVRGCQSVVHLFARGRPGNGAVLDFLADSDAAIVRGLIAVLQRVLSGHRAEQILAFDPAGFFRRLGLDQHLSGNRRNGLEAMVQRLRQEAARIAETVAGPTP